MKKYIISLSVLLVSLGGFAQTVLIQEDEPQRVYEETNWGPNRQYFGYWFYDYGFAIPTETKYDIKIGSSAHWNMGYAYKVKTLSFMDIGLEGSYSNYFFELNDAVRESFDTTRNWDKIRTFQNGVQGQAFLRFYLSPKRGNYFGTYLDLGFYADYHWKSGWYKKLKDDDLKIKQRDYANSDFVPLSYGPSIAFGRNQISAFAQYNLNAVLDENVTMNPMPKLIFGVKLNMYQAY